MTTRHIDIGDEPASHFIVQALRPFREEVALQAWGMWRARIAGGCPPTELAAALLHALSAGYCQPGDPLASVDADVEDAALQVCARSLYKHLLTLHPKDSDEGLEIARAIVAMPCQWQRLESRDPTVRDCINAARAEADAAEVV